MTINEAVTQAMFRARDTGREHRIIYIKGSCRQTEGAPEYAVQAIRDFFPPRAVIVGRALPRGEFLWN
jgi:hypothetical protein